MSNQAMLLKKANNGPALKIILVGDAKTGKTQFARRCFNYPPENYSPTLGVEVYPYAYRKKDGTYSKINIWDCAGDKNFMGLKDGYWLATNCAIVFSDNYIPQLEEKGIEYVKFNPSLTLEQHLGL